MAVIHNNRIRTSHKKIIVVVPNWNKYADKIMECTECQLVLGFSLSFYRSQVCKVNAHSNMRIEVSGDFFLLTRVHCLFCWFDLLGIFQPNASRHLIGMHGLPNIPSFYFLSLPQHLSPTHHSFHLFTCNYVEYLRLYL